MAHQPVPWRGAIEGYGTGLFKKGYQQQMPWSKLQKDTFLQSLPITLDQCISWEWLRDGFIRSWYHTFLQGQGPGTVSKCGFELTGLGKASYESPAKPSCISLAPLRGLGWQISRLAEQGCYAPLFSWITAHGFPLFCVQHDCLKFLAPYASASTVRVEFSSRSDKMTNKS